MDKYESLERKLSEIKTCLGELVVYGDATKSYVVNYGNKKLEDNFRRIRTFFDAVWLLFWCNVDQAKHPGCARRSRSKGAF